MECERKQSVGLDICSVHLKNNLEFFKGFRLKYCFFVVFQNGESHSVNDL